MHARLEKLRSKREEGFTLIEMLIVVMILAILAVVGLLAVGTIQDRTNHAACDTAAATVTTAAAAYVMDTNANPAPPADMAAFVAAHNSYADAIAAIQTAIPAYMTGASGTGTFGAYSVTAATDHYVCS